MARPIKFRAWHKDIDAMISSTQFEALLNGKRVAFGRAPAFTYEFQSPIESSIVILEGNPFNMPSLEIMQYTGIKDENRVEIYEGDIVRGLEFDEATETWIPGEEVTDVKWTTSYKPGFAFPQMCEVIGNIYEHPHLLEDK